MPAIVGLSRGAKNENHPLSRRSRFPRAASAALVRDDLSRPGLAGDVFSRDARSSAGTAAVDHHPHPVADRLQLLGRDVELRLCGRRRHRLPAAAAAVVDRLDEVRCDTRAAVGDRRHVDRHRHRRHRDRALADSYRDRFAGVPLLVPGLLLPLGRWHQTRDLVGQIDAALHAKPEQRGPLVDAIDAEHVGDGVEVDVTRLRNRGLEVDRPVAALLPALEIASVEVGPASAVHVEVRIDDVLFEAGQRRPPS